MKIKKIINKYNKTLISLILILFMFFTKIDIELLACIFILYQLKYKI